MISYGNLWDHLVIKQMTPSIKFYDILVNTLLDKLGDRLLNILNFIQSKYLELRFCTVIIIRIFEEAPNFFQIIMRAFIDPCR